jgi:excinuclease ABC subunit C
VLEETGVMPDLLLIDGGRGQLNAALSALAELGVEETPVVGLAKREEQLYLPARPAPLALRRQDPGLQLLQQIRDEAHRRALRHHRQQRDSKAKGTIFETLPGIGPSRRRAILHHFGSVERFLDASQEELEGVPGLPQKTARALYATLHKAGPS